MQLILQQDPFSGTVFVFRSKRADRVKLLVYDGTGLVLTGSGWRVARSSGRQSATG
jgi:transposase